MKPNLFGQNLKAIQKICQSLGTANYTGRQIAQWLYQKHSRTIESMSDLKKTFREKLAQDYAVQVIDAAQCCTSSDHTKKYLFAFAKGCVETALIPEEDRTTLCVSTQIGCKRGCLFCCTAKQGFQGDLTSSEILNQYEALPERDEISNLVYMGMGEPLDNLEAVLMSLEILAAPWGYAKSPGKITVSTIGILPQLTTFMQASQCGIALSLHSPFEEERQAWLPGTKPYALKDVIAALRNDQCANRRITFEYIVLNNLNHSLQHVKELARLLNGLSCRINLIPFHPFPNAPFQAPSLEQIQAFQAALKAKGLITFLRKSRGQEISAACGLLSTKYCHAGSLQS